MESAAFLFPPGKGNEEDSGTLPAIPENSLACRYNSPSEDFSVLCRPDDDMMQRAEGI
jgi:hypothetical protein